MRTAAERWVLLSTLLGSVERCLEANARIDATMEALAEAFPARRRGRPRTTLVFHDDTCLQTKRAYWRYIKIDHDGADP